MQILVIRAPILPYSPFACVYRIDFGLGNFYIGSTTDLEGRIDGHASSIKKGSRDLNEYIGIISGRYTVTFEVLEEIKDVAILTEREQYYLDCNIEDECCLNVAKIASINWKVKKILEMN